MPSRKRSAPTSLAKEFKGKTMVGNDLNRWKSKRMANGIYRWFMVARMEWCETHLKTGKRTCSYKDMKSGKSYEIVELLKIKKVN